MNNWNFPLSLNILEPLCLNSDTAASGRSKPATLFHNEREHVFNLWLTGCTYLGRSEFRAEGKNTIKDVFGYLWSGGWIPVVFINSPSHDDISAPPRDGIRSASICLDHGPSILDPGRPQENSLASNGVHSLVLDPSQSTSPKSSTDNDSVNMRWLPRARETGSAAFYDLAYVLYCASRKGSSTGQEAGEQVIQIFGRINRQSGK